MKKSILFLFLLIGLTAYAQNLSYEGVELGSDYTILEQNLMAHGYKFSALLTVAQNVMLDEQKQMMKDKGIDVDLIEYRIFTGKKFGYSCQLTITLSRNDNRVLDVEVNNIKDKKGAYTKIRGQLIDMYGNPSEDNVVSAAWKFNNGLIVLGTAAQKVFVNYSLDESSRIVRGGSANQSPALSLTDQGSLDNATAHGSDLANKAMTVTVRPGVTTDEAWKRIVFVVSDIFPNLEQSDKSSGWIRSAWELQRYGNVVVRTRIDIKEVPGQDDLRYRVKIESEIGETSCGLDDQCFQPWDLVLKKYDEAIRDLMSSLQ